MYEFKIKFGAIPYYALGFFSSCLYAYFRLGLVWPAGLKRVLGPLHKGLEIG